MMHNMQPWIVYFKEVLATSFAIYFQQDGRHGNIWDVPQPAADFMESEIGEELSPQERLVLLLALMPHVAPDALDLFFVQNKTLDRPYTQFGGWKAQRHTGFLPTGLTAAFLLRTENSAVGEEIFRMFGKEGIFYRRNILHLVGQEAGEPFLSGRLAVSDEFLACIIPGGVYSSEHQPDFAAKRLHTTMEWGDLIVPPHVRRSLEDIAVWMHHAQEIRQQGCLDAIIKPGYRCLFYGPPGTGKTLAATLLGKQHGLDVFRIDLSMMVSKYIGETEKNLSKIFDRAAQKDWILFFDEADALFGKRTQTNNSNDRYANQEVSYLLQRVEDFPGFVVLATNLKDEVDEAFLRRFQQVVHFPMPDARLRRQLWDRWIPEAWTDSDRNSLLDEAADVELAGGTIVNVIQRCAIWLHRQEGSRLTQRLLRDAIRHEQEKQGIMVEH